jgi:dephospho-CoA kinase
VLTVGLTGEGGPAAARRCRELSNDEAIAVRDLVSPTGSWAECQLVIAVVAPPDDDRRGAVDVVLDDDAALEPLWNERVVPFAANLASGRRAPRRRVPVLLPSDPAWPAQARRLVARLGAAIGPSAIRIDHIGSTSVPGLAAKDLIDVQVVVADLATADLVATKARGAGFVRAIGSWTGSDRLGTEHPEVVVVDADPGRPVNVNLRPVDAPVWREALLFRDWLRSNPGEADAYAALKRDLAAAPGPHVDAYGEAKMPWIRAALRRAETWAAEQAWSP